MFGLQTRIRPEHQRRYETDIRRAEEAVLRAIETGLEAEGKAVKRRYRRNVPKRSGELFKSIDYRLEGRAPRQSVVVFATAKQALFVERGTKAHVIQPKKAHGLLVFVSGGQLVFVRGPVQHPGTKAQKPLARALRRSRGVPQIRRVLTQKLR